MSAFWDQRTRAYLRAERARGARLFGLGFAALPVVEVIDRRGLLHELVGALASGQVPGGPARHWIELLGFVLLGWAAARVSATLCEHGSRRELLWFATAGALLLGAYALAAGAWLTGLVSQGALWLGITTLLATRAAAEATAPSDDG